MGTPGKVMSFGTEMLPTALASANPLSAALVGVGMTSGDTAQQQLEKYGDINEGSSLRSGVLSGVLDSGANYLTKGLSRRLPADVDVIGRAATSNASSNQISDTMTDTVGNSSALDIERMLAELRRRKEGGGVLI